MLKELWLRIRLGAIPLILISIPVGLGFYLWGRVDTWGRYLHLDLTGNVFYDVPISLSILLVATWLLGSLFKKAWFKDFGEKHFLKVPLIGGILFALIIDRKLELVEVRTVPGINSEFGGCWEYAIVTKDPWEERGILWYRAHTLGLTSNRLFSRIILSTLIQMPFSSRIMNGPGVFNK